MLILIKPRINAPSKGIVNIPSVEILKCHFLFECDNVRGDPCQMKGIIFYIYMAALSFYKLFFFLIYTSLVLATLSSLRQKKKMGEFLRLTFSDAEEKHWALRFRELSFSVPG